MDSLSDKPKILKIILGAMQNILAENLLGVYVYGSLATGGYNELKSDCDILVVTAKGLSKQIRSKIIESMLALSDKASGGGFELTVILKKVLGDLKYPTPIELYFSTDIKEKFIKGEMDLSKPILDKGLAVNIASLKRFGLCLFGESIEKIIPDVPRGLYIEAAIYDFEWSYNNVMRDGDSGLVWVPAYAVLNACRIAALIRDGIFGSKKDGGEWGIKNLPKEFHPVIITALREYKISDRSNKVNFDVLKKFMNYIKSNFVDKGNS